MKIIIFKALFCACVTFNAPMWAMETESVFPQAIVTHQVPILNNEQKCTPVSQAELLAKIDAVTLEKNTLRQEHELNKVRLYNNWDRKVAVAASIPAVLAALKTGYDVYRFSQGDTSAWSSITFLSLDGFVLTGTTATALFHLGRSLLRKPTTE